jgi:hypothetical protein
MLELECAMPCYAKKNYEKLMPTAGSAIHIERSLANQLMQLMWQRL